MQYSFIDCKNNIALRFDFYLPEHNTCIEYDGIQHFKPIKFFNGKAGLLKTIKHDQIKNRYCQNNNINLIRIKYNQRKNLKNILNM